MTATDFPEARAPLPAFNDPAWGDEEDRATPSPIDRLGSSWEPLDAVAMAHQLLTGAVEPTLPTVATRGDGRSLLYPGRVNGIAGESGSGKTWTALYACRQELTAARNVVYLDYEDTLQGVVERLLALGAGPEDLSYFKYVHPDERFGEEARVRFVEHLREWDPTLVVIDSTGEALAVEGRNQNADDEVAVWFNALPRLVASMGPAVLVLDHVAKAAGGDATFAIGSQRKRAAINGHQLMQAMTEPFSREQRGRAELKCAKDRLGNFTRGEVVAVLSVWPLVGPGGRVGVSLDAPSPARGQDGFRPTGLMEAVSRALEGCPDGATARRLRELVKGRTADISAATVVLAQEGFVRIDAGARGSQVHVSVRPYRQIEDPSSDRFQGTGSGPVPPYRGGNREPVRSTGSGTAGNQWEPVEKTALDLG